MDLDTILKTIQSAVTETPLIMVGSGASAPHGLPSMHDLGKHWFTNSALVIAALPAGTTLKQI